MRRLVRKTTQVRYTARPFLTATPTSFHLEPGHSQVVQVDANVPIRSVLVGLYAIISLRSEEIQPRLGNGEEATSEFQSGQIFQLLTIASSELKQR